MNKLKDYRAHFKDYIRLGLPIIIGSMTVVFISWGDNIMVSRLGSVDALAAVSLANLICGVPLLFLVGISTILAPIVASLIANDNYEEATQNLKHTLAINTTFGVLSSILLISFSKQLHTIGQPLTVAHLAEQYLCIIAISIVPAAVSNTLKRYLAALGWTVHTMCLSISSGILNVILNYILIYGKLGLPAFGLIGAALATLTTRFIFMGLYLCYSLLLKKKGYIVSISWKVFKEKYFIKLLKLGLPSGLQLALKMAYFSAGTIMFGWLGSNAQASTSILFDIIRFAIMLPLAVGICASILIGRQWGKRNKTAMYNLGQVAYILASGLTCAMGVLLYLLYPYILHYLYAPEQVVQALISSLIGLMILFQLVDGLSLVGVGILRGVQDTLAPFIISTLAYSCIGLPTSYILAFKLGWGVAGVWWGLILGVATSTCLLYPRFYYITKLVKFTKK